MSLPPRHAAVLAVVAGLLLPSVAAACLWDYDTIRMERSRFPGTLELITGKFLRHSPEFYQWRIEDRLRRLQSHPADAALLDDLAVAYDKTSQHDLAIETALKTEKLYPGRYETAANLGTFYIHAGRLEEGLAHIERALQINPDAHFGREAYQKRLVEYVIARTGGNPPTLPLAEVTVHPEMARKSPSAHDVSVRESFADFLRAGSQDGRLGPEESSAAVRGVLGMMKFGRHDSPVLLEALGTLLTHWDAEPTDDAKLLAARAFLKASYEVPDGPARAAYRGMAAQSLGMQTPRRDREGQISLERVEKDFQSELAEAEAWYAALRERELSWIRGGKNPEAEFDKLYDADPEVSGMDVTDPPSAREIRNRYITAGAVALILTFVAAIMLSVFFMTRVWRSRAARLEAADNPGGGPR